jgi:hypothetical protein
MLQRIADELNGIARNPKQPDEFTANELVQKLGGTVALNTAMRKLEQMVKAGALTKRNVILNGKRTNLYREAK